jgi:hypothetical protein
VLFFLNPVRVRQWLVVGLVLRLVVGLGYGWLGSWELVPLDGPTRDVAGTDGHLQIARTLWTDGRWAYSPADPPVHNRPPLPPLALLVGGAWSARYWFWVWVVFGTVLHGVAGWLLVQALIGQGAGARVVGWAACVWALHPYWLLPVRSTTFLTVALVVGSMVVWAWARVCRRLAQDAGRGLWWGVAGALAVLGLALGLAALTHGAWSVLVWFFALAVVGVMWGEHRKRLWSGLACAVPVVVVALAVQAPWLVRNQLAWPGQLGPLTVATGGGIQYWKGKAYFDGTPHLEAAVYAAHTGQPLVQRYFGPLTPAEDAWFLRWALADMAADPWGQIRRTAQAAVFFWYPTDGAWPLAKATLTFVLNGGLWLHLVWLLRHRRLTGYRLGLWAALLATWAVFAVLGGHAAYFPMVYPFWFGLWADPADLSTDPQPAAAA